MSLQSAVRLYPETLRSLAFGGISAVYAALGTPFLNPPRIMHIVNGTNGDLLFSFDNTIAAGQWIISAGSFLLLDICANQTLNSGAFLGQGSQVWVKQSTAPSAGSVYLTVWYGIAQF